MRRDRHRTRLAERMLEQAERDGLVRWNGQWRNGKKVYVGTDAGREWAQAALDEEDEA